ncbi:MAG: hypothetical protein K0Q47_27 [Sedimentibacter sp.]|nr:hypothetical protein [Sedimentibacter sp.]
MKEIIIDLINSGANGLIWCVEMVDKFLLFCKSVHINFTFYDVIMMLLLAAIVYFVGKKVIIKLLSFKYKRSRSRLEARIGLKHRLAIDSTINKKTRPRIKIRKAKKVKVEQAAYNENQDESTNIPEDNKIKDRNLSFDERLEKIRTKPA